MASRHAPLGCKPQLALGCSHECLQRCAPRGTVASPPSLKIRTLLIPLSHFLNVPPLPPGIRLLAANALTSLEVGVFDKNTALIHLYVDPSAKGWDMPSIRMGAQLESAVAGITSRHVRLGCERQLALGCSLGCLQRCVP